MFPDIRAHFPLFLRDFALPARESMHISRYSCTLSPSYNKVQHPPSGEVCMDRTFYAHFPELMAIFAAVRHGTTIHGTITMIKDIYFAAGCFWGAQKYFKLIDGVVGTAVGYANGDILNPTYKEVYTDTTGYAETVHVQYDTSYVSLKFLVSMFFKAIDPLSMNKQGEDVGTRYRTGIYYTKPEDFPIIHDVYVSVEKEYGCKLAVEVLPLKNFYTAEEMHQDYLDKNPEGYCHLPESLFEFARNAGKK